MRVAVIGGTGFIGHHVSRCLAAGGQDVTGIQRGSTPNRVPGLRSLAADRHDAAALTVALAEAAPAAVVDMVAYTAADADALCAALPASTERLIVISSGDVYRTYDAFRGLCDPVGSGEPLSESGPLRERLFPYRSQASGADDPWYWYEKILVEQTAQAGSLAPVTILRLPMVYGPGDPHRRVESYLERLEADRSGLRLNPAEAGWRCTRGYVEDVAEAIALATTDQRAAGQVYNVGESGTLTELEWAVAIGRAAGWDEAVEPDESVQPSLPANWSVALVVDTRRIRAQLGFSEPVGRAEGLRRTVGAASS